MTPDERERQITACRHRFVALRGELAALKSFVAADAVAHAVNLLDRSRRGTTDDAAGNR